jgi:hypothetical protein
MYGNIIFVLMYHRHKILHLNYRLKYFDTCRSSLFNFVSYLQEFFNRPNPSSRTTAPGSTQPLTKMSTRNLPGG